MPPATYVPHIAQFLHALRITRDRLDSRSKIAVDPRLLVQVIRQSVAALPFDPGYYLATYDDVAQAHASGGIADLHAHFIESGYFEGRLGADPAVDRRHYLATYPDVGRAIAEGQIASASDHYTQRGAAEGRAANPDQIADITRWMTVLRPDA